MKQKKFFEKFLENLSRLDESKIKQYLEHVESERRTYRQILNALDESIIVIEEDRVLFVNTEAMKLLNAPQLKPPVTLEEARRTVGNSEIIDFIVVTLHDTDYVTEWVSGSRDKRHYQVEKITTESGEDRFFIIKITDMTESRRMEFQLKNLESVSALNTLAAGVAHEIKNPLAAMDLHTQILKKGIDKGMITVPDEVSEYIRIIEEEQRRLSRIVQDFLTAARKRELKWSFEDINCYLEEILSFFKPELDSYNITLETALESVPQIFIDRDYLRQALTNLIKNAMEAMNGASVRVLTVRTWFDNSANTVNIVLRDTGMGIPQDRLTRIFDPYFTTKDSGTGLGLTIVYKIVKEHGGDIRVESEENRGSTFTVVLPLHRGIRMIGNS